MRQSVEILARVTFDAPAGLNRAELQEHAQWALANAKAIPAVAVSAGVLAIREEAAMFNSNGDQWEADSEKPWHLHKGDERFSVAADFGADAKEPARIARDVAEALNFMAGRVSPPDAAASETLGEQEEGPKPYTVIWRPTWGDAFRGDHVLAADAEVETVMAAAFDVVRAEMGEQGSTEEEIAECIAADQTYDLCAILDGHARFVF